MKPIKRLQYMMFATIVATASHKLPASGAATPVRATTAISISAKPTTPKLDPKSQANLQNIASHSRNAEIAAQRGSMKRLASRMSDAVFGKKVVRDPLTNQKITDLSMIDSLSLQPETQVMKQDGIASLDLSSISKDKDFAANKVKRNLTDTASNYARNLVSRSNKKLTKRQEQNTAHEYKGFAKPGDKIVETWSPDGKRLLESKILSPDGSYKIISNKAGGEQGKIISARTADGKTTQNTYYDNGIIKTSVTTTPRTLNALQKNSMQTRAETTYFKNGYPERTTTYKESLVGNPLLKSDVLSVKTYNKDNPLGYELKAGTEVEAKTLEKRVVNTTDNGTTLTTQVPSSQDKFRTKQIIKLDKDNNITSIQTFEKTQDSKTNQAHETLTFNDDGSVVKTVTNAKGKQEKTITVDSDQMVIDAAYESISGNIRTTTTKQSVVELNPSKNLSKEQDTSSTAANLDSTAKGSGQKPLDSTPTELNVDSADPSSAPRGYNPSTTQLRSPIFVD